MQYQYRVPLSAWIPQTPGYYEFTATSDQDAAKKVGYIGTPHLEVFSDGQWFGLNLNANIEFPA